MLDGQPFQISNPIDHMGIFEMKYDKNSIRSRAENYGKFGELLRKKFTKVALHKVDETNEINLKNIMEENLETLEKLSFSVLGFDVPIDPPKLQCEDYIWLINQFLEPLKIPEIRKRFYPKEVDILNSQILIEKEITWIEVWKESFKSGFLDFERIELDDLYYFHGYKVKHPWHHYCPYDSVMLDYEGKFSTGYDPVDKIDLLVALICANLCKQIARVWDYVEPVSEVVREYSNGCGGGWYDMVLPEAANYGKRLIASLDVEIERWMCDFVICEKCQKPGCFGLITCSNSLALQYYKDSDYACFGDVFNAMVEIEPALQDSFDGFHSLFIPSTLEFLNPVATFIFIASNFFGYGSFSSELALRAYHDPSGAKKLSNFLKVSGLVHSRIGSILCDLDKLSCFASDKDLIKTQISCDMEHLEQVIQQLLAQEINIHETIEYSNLKEFVKSIWINKKILIGDILELVRIIKFCKNSNEYFVSIMPDFEIPLLHEKLVMEKLSVHLGFRDQKIDFSDSIMKNIVRCIVMAAYFELACPIKDFRYYCVQGNIILVSHDLKSIGEVLDKLKSMGLTVKANCSAESVVLPNYIISDKFCRSIGIVSTIKRLCSLGSNNSNTAECIRSYAEEAWSLVNRSGSKRIAEIFHSSMQKSTGLSKEICLKILRGEVGVEGSPVRKGDFEIECLFFDFEVSGSISIAEFNDYIVPEVEFEALKALGITINNSTETNLIISDIKPIMKTIPIAPGSISDYDVVRSTSTIPQVGILSNYKILLSIKNHIPIRKLQELMKITGSSLRGKDLYEMAWGSRSLVIKGAFPFEDSKDLYKWVNKDIGKFIVNYQMFV